MATKGFPAQIISDGRITIDNDIRKELKLKDGDWVWANIQKLPEPPKKGSKS